MTHYTRSRQPSNDVRPAWVLTLIFRLRQLVHAIDALIRGPFGLLPLRSPAGEAALVEDSGIVVFGTEAVDICANDRLL